MALRVLTSAEKEQCLNNIDFQQEVKWAVRDYAAYWSDDTDIIGKVLAAGYTGWAKNRILTESIVRNGLTDPDVVIDFVVLAKSMPLYDPIVNPEFTVAVVITYMRTNNKFDELSSLYAAKRVKEIPF